MIRTTVTRKTDENVVKTTSERRFQEDDDHDIRNLPPRSNSNDMRSLHQTVKQATGVSKAVNGMKYVGKIKMIKVESDSSDDEEEDRNTKLRNSLDYEPGEVSSRLLRFRSGQYESDDEKDGNDKKVNMSEELRYRENMEVKITDSLAAFKGAEQERIQREKAEKEELERKKKEKLEKERIRLKKEEERKLQIQKQLEEKERLRKLKEEEEAANCGDSDSDEESFVNKHQLNLSEEFSYRQEMDTKVSDRLKIFKQVENESQQKSKAEQEESERKKNEKLEKERIRLKKEEERKLQIQKQIEEKERLRKLQEEENPKNGYSSGDTDNEDDQNTSKHQLDLQKEFQYRDEMDSKVSDRLLVFKQVEAESKSKAQLELEANEKKRLEKQQKEEERLRREEARKLKIQQDIEKRREEKMKEEENRNISINQEDGDPEHIRREREIMEEVEKEFLKQGYGNKGSSKTVLKRWNSQENMNKRRSSGDSGIVNEDAVECAVEASVECSPSDPDYERKLLEETEKAFKKYAAKHRTGSTSKNDNDQKNERTSSFGTKNDPRKINEYSGLVVKEHQPSTKKIVENGESSKSEKRTDSLSSNDATLIEEQSKSFEDEKNSLLEKLKIAEKKVSEAEESFNYAKQVGGDASDAEEEFHAASLELSRLKKRLKQLESDNSSMQKKNKDSLKLSRECKVPLDRAPPPVDTNNFNDDGDCVPEGIITHRLRSLSKKMH